MRNTLFTGFCWVAGLLFTMPAAAQDFNRFTFKLGGGFTTPVRASDGRVDTGFNVNAGAGLNFTRHVSAIAEFGFNNADLSRRALTALAVPDGSARVYSVTVNPVVRFNPQGRFDAYLIGGGGYYRRTIELTRPSIGTITLFDPFWGVFYPAAVPVNTVLGTFTQNKAGLNIGGGVAVRISGDSNVQFFAEARYHHIFTTPVGTDMLPVTFGLRW